MNIDNPKIKKEQTIVSNNNSMQGINFLPHIEASSFKNEIKAISETKSAVKRVNPKEEKIKEITNQTVEDSVKIINSNLSLPAAEKIGSLNQISETKDNQIIKPEVNLKTGKISPTGSEVRYNAEPARKQAIKQDTKNKAEYTIKPDTKHETVLDYQTVKLEINDGLFFANLIKNNSADYQITGKEVLIEADAKEVERSIQVSAKLMNALQKAVKINKPFRIDFDKDISVILKIDKKGKISAEFIPGDKAVEEYLKLNLPMLKQAFNQQNLPYEYLSYRRHNHQQQNHNQKNKEKDNE